MADYDYTLDKIGADFVVLDVSDVIVFQDPSFVKASRWMVEAIALINGSGLVKNLGTVDLTETFGWPWQQPPYTGSARAFDFTEHVKLYFEAGLVMRMLVPENWGIMRFDGRYTGDNVRKGTTVEGLGGRVKLIGTGGASNSEKGLYFKKASNVVVRNLEISKVSNQLIFMDGDAGSGLSSENDYNLFEDLYLHEWSMGPYAELGFIIVGSYNVVRRVVVDGMSGTNTRSAFYIGAENARSHDNLIEDSEFKNSFFDNGAYLNGWRYAVTHNTFRRILCSGNHDPGHSGFKFRPSSYNLVEDLISEDNMYGIDIGTGMGTENFQGDDGEGRPYDGWSRGNKFVRGIIRNNLMMGLVMSIDGVGFGLENNEFDLYLYNNPTAIWFCNGRPGSAPPGIEQDNVFYVTIENCQRGIRMESMLSEGSYTRRNYIVGVLKNCSTYGVSISDPGCMDNYFDLVTNGCLIIDNGTRNRWNGVGAYAYGVGIIPPSVEWNDGDIVVNMSDGVTYLKTAGVMKLLPSGQPISQFTLMNAKGGLLPGQVQFIDKSFVPDGAIVEWLWDFGDGSISALQHPVHNYIATDLYNAYLRITTDKGQTAESTALITIELPHTHLLTITSSPMGVPFKIRKVM